MTHSYARPMREESKRDWVCACSIILALIGGQHIILAGLVLDWAEVRRRRGGITGWARSNCHLWGSHSLTSTGPRETGLMPRERGELLRKQISRNSKFADHELGWKWLFFGGFVFGIDSTNHIWHWDGNSSGMRGLTHPLGGFQWSKLKV